MICLYTIAALVLFEILPGLAQHENQAVLEDNTSQSQCTSNDIIKLNVAGCTCPEPNTDCSHFKYVCAGQSFPANSGLQTGSTCGEGSNSASCKSCYIWSHGFCSCVQNILAKKTTNCKSSPSLQSGVDTIWMLNEGRDLITINKPVPGILELSSLPSTPIDYRNVGWRLGQSVSNRTSNALAMNSALRRSEEQIHIHVCDVFQYGNSGQTRDMLTSLKKSDYTTLKKVVKSGLEMEMFCRVSSSKNLPSKGAIIDIADDIADILKRQDICRYQVGAGIVTDNDDYTWACVTTGSNAAESIFCR